MHVRNACPAHAQVPEKRETRTVVGSSPSRTWKRRSGEPRTSDEPGTSKMSSSRHGNGGCSASPKCSRRTSASASMNSTPSPVHSTASLRPSSSRSLPANG